MTVWEPTWTAITSSCTRAESKGAPKGSHDVFRAATFVAILLCMCVLGLLFEESRLPSFSIQHPIVKQSKFGESASKYLAPQENEAKEGELRKFHDSPAGSSIQIRPTSTPPEPSNSQNDSSLVAKSGGSAVHKCEVPHLILVTQFFFNRRAHSEKSESNILHIDLPVRTTFSIRNSLQSSPQLSLHTLLKHA